MIEGSCVHTASFVTELDCFMLSTSEANFILTEFEISLMCIELRETYISLKNKFMYKHLLKIVGVFSPQKLSI